MASLVAGIVLFVGAGVLWGVLAYYLWFALDDPGQKVRPVQPVWLVLLSGPEGRGDGERVTLVSEDRRERFTGPRIGGG